MNFNIRYYLGEVDPGSNRQLLADLQQDQWHYDIFDADEQFDVDEEELERTLSLGTAEKLRDAAVPAMQSLSAVQEVGMSQRAWLSLLANL